MAEDLALIRSELDANHATLRSTRSRDLISCNSVPHDIEASQYRRILTDTETAIRTLNVEVSQLEDRLRYVRDLRRRATFQHSATAAILHPLRFVPADILRLIFIYANPSAEGIADSETHNSLSSLHAPWTLSQVCAEWRRVALDYPQLWSFINLSLVPVDEQPEGSQTQRRKLGLLLERSQKCLLDVRLEGTNTPPRHDVLVLLEFSASRWRSLTTILPTHALECLSGFNFASLEKLRAHTCTGDSPAAAEPVEMVVQVFQSALRMRSLFNADPGLVIQLAECIWSDIEDIDDYCPLGPALSHIPRMRQIHDLRISLPSDLSAIDNMSMITLPQLELLEIVEDSSGQIYRVFSKLKLPALRILRLIYDGTIPGATFPNIAPSATGVTNLYLDYAVRHHPEDSEALLSFLRALPNIEELRLTIGDVPKEILAGLTIIQRDTTLLPRLRHLDIHRSASFHEGVTDDHILSMLESRIGSEKDDRLERLTVWPKWDEDWFEEETSCERWSLIREKIEVECGTLLSDDV